MKVLHVWNVSGVSSVIAKWMDRTCGTESEVVMRKAFDKFNFTSTHGKTWNVGAQTFVFRALLEARDYDVIHVHSLDKIVPYLKRLYPRKPVVLHYHGVAQTELWSKSESRWKKADAVLIFGADQLANAPSRVQVSETPVDTDIFHPMAEKPVPGTALHIEFGEDELANKLANDYNLKLTIHDSKKNPIEHSKFPRFLGRFEYYIDVKNDWYNRGIRLNCLSKTALEALAVGSKVIKPDRLITELPAENRPEVVVKKLYGLYQGLLENRDGPA
jgi:glycosyl transferase family 4